jgi:hypothetical protein
VLLFLMPVSILLTMKLYNDLLCHLLVESKEEAHMRLLLRSRIARILYKNETIPNENIFISLTSVIFDNRHFRSGTTRQWTFPGAFYFSTLVVTLIGKDYIKLIDN